MDFLKGPKNIIASARNRTDNYLNSLGNQQVPSTAPVNLGRLGNPNAVTTAPPQRSFSQDQQYLRDTANTMYGKGQPISTDMRDYYSQKWADNDMDFNNVYPVAQQPTPVVQQPRMGAPVRY